MSIPGPAEEIAKLEERQQKIHIMILQEKQNHERRLAGLNATLSDVSSKLAQHRQRNGQQEQFSGNASTHHDLLTSQPYDNATSSNGGSSTDKHAPGIASPHSPPGFSGRSQPQAQNEVASASRQPQVSSTPDGSRSVFNRLGQSPSQPQQASVSQQLRSQTPTYQDPPQISLSTHELPPGFASPGGFLDHSTPGRQDQPPGSQSPQSSVPLRTAQRSRMRSDQMAESAQSAASSRRSAQPPMGKGGVTGGPPGFEGLPAHLVQRLSPSPAQTLDDMSNQARPNSPQAISTSPKHVSGNGPWAAQSSRQHFPAAAYDASSDDSPGEQPPGFARANGTAGQNRQSHTANASSLIPPGDGRAPPGPVQRDGPPDYSNGSVSQAEEQDEFPGLAFGIKELDQRPKFSSTNSRQDFPSLGAPTGSQGTHKPTGVWGRGMGHLAGSLKQQQQQEQQVSHVTSSLAAAVQSPQPATVHIERVELGAHLRVAGDDASDSVRRKRSKKHEFESWQRVKGMGTVNVVQGLELYENVLSPDEQTNMVHIIEDWVVQGKQGRLRGRTFSAPRKWARGKGRITCQFGCCYNYAIDSEGRKPGIVAEEVVEKMPPVLVSLCKRLIRWGILPKHKEPDTAIVNVYDVEDCIPPHIDHHDFDRPFCTISLLSQQNIMFGSRIISRGPGDFEANYQMPLPTGSCLVLKGNGADVSQHCVPPVSARRMSITLRRMQDVHARRVVAMAERIHAGLPVDTDNPPSGPQR